MSLLRALIILVVHPSRHEMLAKREKYEAKHMGAYERIYPSHNQELQELYEKLLKGAMELFQSSFQVRFWHEE